MNIENNLDQNPETPGKYENLRQSLRERKTNDPNNPHWQGFDIETLSENDLDVFEQILNHSLDTMKFNDLRHGVTVEEKNERVSPAPGDFLSNFTARELFYQYLANMMVAEGL